ncbi:hypothetical protein G7Y79_00039g075410 [Physcia stellaris]|nr:hypothetical protein G7Y79_00039g075410 [Physcia stellaris]
MRHPDRSTLLDLISKNGESITVGFAILVIVFLLRLIYHFIRSRFASHPKSPDLHNIAAAIEQLPAHAQLTIGNRPFPIPNPTPSPPVSRGSHELAGWTGLRSGVTLGFGLGIVACWGYLWESRPHSIVLALVLWWTVWQQRENRNSHPGSQQTDDELHALEYQAAFFGSVLGLGFGGLVGVGLHLELPFHWLAGLCVLWTLVWSTQGAGVTWLYEERKLRLKWFSIGGSRCNVVFWGVGGIQTVLTWLGWFLLSLVNVVIWLYSTLSSSQRRSRTDLVASIEENDDSSTLPAAAHREEIGETEASEERVAVDTPRRQLVDTSPEETSTVEPTSLNSEPRVATNRRGHLRREMSALGLGNR